MRQIFLTSTKITLPVNEKTSLLSSFDQTSKKNADCGDYKLK
jgi:hypothetical protein